MNEKVEKFLRAVDENPDLRKRLKCHTKNKPDLNNMSFDDKIKFAYECIIPFAKENGFELGVEDILVNSEENLQKIDEKFFEKIGGGVNRHLAVSILAAAQSLALMAPVGIKATDIDSLPSLAQSSAANTKDAQTQGDYDNIFSILKNNYEKLPVISEKSPMNEIDGLIFAELSYLPMNCVPNLNSDMLDKDISLQEFSSRLTKFFKSSDQKLNIHYEDEQNVKKYRKIESRNSKIDDSHIGISEKQLHLLWFLAHCPRYQNIKIGNFHGRYSDIKNLDYEQFAAVTFTLENGTKVVVFRGTDSTLTGWKEDFDLSWSSEVPAQKHALTYLKKIYSLYPNSEFVVEGHSKGGNLAAYSSFLLCKENENFLNKNLVEILNYDGPGLKKDIVESAQPEVSEKLTTFIPQSSIIGRIMSETSKGAFVCVHSLSDSIMNQHDMFSWNVKCDYCGEPELSKFESYRLKPESDLASDAISLFMEGIESKDEAMKAFVDWFFNFVNDNGIDYNNDFDLRKSIQSAFYNYFIKGKSSSEVIKILFASVRSLSVDDKHQESFKIVMSNMAHALVKVYWMKHTYLNKKFSVPSMVKTVFDKIISIDNLAKFFKKLYS